MARKKLKPAEKTDIRIRADETLIARIKAAADQEGNSIAAFVRAAVVKELKRREMEDRT